MLQKKKRKYYMFLLYTQLQKSIQTYNIKNVAPKIYSLDGSMTTKLLHTGKFFKKLAFFGLAFNGLTEKKYHLTTFKSLIKSLWNTIAAYSIIF